jgi:hypothetical protein
MLELHLRQEIRGSAAERSADFLEILLDINRNPQTDLPHFVADPK